MARGGARAWFQKRDSGRNRPDSCDVAVFKDTSGSPGEALPTPPPAFSRRTDPCRPASQPVLCPPVLEEAQPPWTERDPWGGGWPSASPRVPREANGAHP